MPIHDPVLKFAVMMAIILAAPMISARLRLPGVIGLILAGLAAGPHGLGLLERDAAVVLLGTVGLLYIMFVAGVEVDLHEFRKARRRSAAFGALTFLIPQCLGTLIAVWVLGYSWTKAVLLASMFASHTLVAYPVVNALGLVRKESVIVTLGATVITDTAALLVLAFIAASQGGTLDAAFVARLIVFATLFATGVFVGIPWLGRRFFESVGSEGGPQYLFVLTVLFGCSYLAHVAGLEPILGAFFAGLALNRLIPEHGTLMNRIQFFGHHFFIPFFLLHVGMLVNVRALALDGRAWTTAAVMVGAVLATKYAAARTAQRLFGYTPEEGVLMFSLSVAQAAATLAAVLVGYRIGVFDDAVLNGTVVMMLVTCLLAPWLAQRAGRRLALRELHSPAPAAPRERVLVPVAHPQTAQNLCELAALLRRAAHSDAPLHLLHVVGSRADAEDAVAGAEEMLGACLANAAAGGVPAAPAIRIEMNVADGVLRAVRELRITTLVVGWKGFTSARDRLFGSIFDRILAECPSRIWLCRIERPLATAQRMVLVLSARAEYDARLDATLQELKLLARQLSAPVHALIAGNPEGNLRERIEKAAPQTALAVSAFPTLRAVREHLDGALHRDDLLVILGARTHSLPWQPGMDGFARELAAQRPHNPLLVAYPAAPAASEIDPIPALDAPAPPAPLLPGLVHTRVTPAADLASAVEDMLRPLLGEQPDVLETACNALCDMAQEWRPEVAPGILLLHTHTSVTKHSSVVVAATPSGFVMPPLQGPIRAVILVLGGEDESPDAHLATLSSIARWLRRPGIAARLSDAKTESDLRALLAAPDLA